MKNIETQTLDFVNTGIGAVKAVEEQIGLVLDRAGKTVAEFRQNTEKAIEDARRNVEKTFEDLKVRGALDDSEQAQQLREVAVGAARRIG